MKIKSRQYEMCSLIFDPHGKFCQDILEKDDLKLQLFRSCFQNKNVHFCVFKALFLSLLVTTDETFVESVDQDQTAQNVRSYL